MEHTIRRWLRAGRVCSLPLALFALFLPAGCGSSAPASAAPTAVLAPTVSVSPTEASPVTAVRDTVTAYIAARQRALVAGGADVLSGFLAPGSPAAATEPFVAAGRVQILAQQGLQVVAAAPSTQIAAPPSFYQGAEPLAADVGTTDEGALRAVVFARESGALTLSDGRQVKQLVDHVLTLVLYEDQWVVFRDRYLDRDRAVWLEAGGAAGWQVRAARRQWTAYELSRRRAYTPASAVRAFIALLAARRYAEADLFLAFDFHGTAEGMGGTFRRMKLVSSGLRGKPQPGEAVVVAGLQVVPRYSLWNKGLNVRFFRLRQEGAFWSIVDISSGP